MPSAAEVHAALVARVQERLALAQHAVRRPGAEISAWTAGARGVLNDERGGIGELYSNGITRHIAANDPAFTIRLCTAALNRLERHRPVSSSASSTPDWCPCCGEDAPCPDVRDEAAVWNVELT